MIAHNAYTIKGMAACKMTKISFLSILLFQGKVQTNLNNTIKMSNDYDVKLQIAL